MKEFRYVQTVAINLKGREEINKYSIINIYNKL
jgi:hypothetical protein